MFTEMRESLLNFMLQGKNRMSLHQSKNDTSTEIVASRPDPFRPLMIVESFCNIIVCAIDRVFIVGTIAEIRWVERFHAKRSKENL